MAFSDKEASTKNYERQAIEEKHFFLTIQQKLQNYGGLLPPKNFLNTTWKVKLYNVWVVILLIWFGTTIILQFLVLYENHETVDDITSILFEMSASFVIVSILTHFTIYRNKMYSIITKVEESFNDHTKELPFTIKHRNILTQTAKRNKLFVWSTIILTFVALPVWVIRPLIMWYTYEGDDIYQTNENENVRFHWEFFCSKMWLPPNAYHTPVYQTIFCFQLCNLILMLSNYTSFFTFFFSLSAFGAAHFKVLTELVRDADKYIEYSNIKQNRTESEDDSENTITMNNNSVEDDDNEHEELKHQILTAAEDNVQIPGEVDYFVKCIKYHQAILAFFNDLQVLYGPILFVIFALYGILLCLTTFQATSSSDEQSFLKFMMVSLTLWPTIFICCWHGEDLSQKGLEVQQAVYDCKWYNSTTRYKKHIQFVIMRSQKPINLTGGGLFPINLQGFASIANNAYAYFTLLRQTQQE